MLIFVTACFKFTLHKCCIRITSTFIKTLKRDANKDVELRQDLHLLIIFSYSKQLLLCQKLHKYKPRHELHNNWFWHSDLVLPTSYFHKH